MSNLKTFHSKKYSNKSAFTLIELSVVLIIIGLLLAGTVVGIALVNSAALRQVINEARGYQVAVNTFYVQFHKLPGDFGTILDGGGSTVSPNKVGDENGAIEYVNGVSITQATREGITALQQLSAVSLIDDTLVFASNSDLETSNGNKPTAVTCGIELPNSRITDSCWVFDYRDSQNVIIITHTGVTQGSNNHTTNTADEILNGNLTGVFTPSDAWSVDIKMDDGVSNTGDVRDTFATTSATISENDCSSTTSSVTTGIYTTATTTTECTLSFTMDSVRY